MYTFITLITTKHSIKHKPLKVPDDYYLLKIATSNIFDILFLHIIIINKRKVMLEENKY